MDGAVVFGSCGAVIAIVRLEISSQVGAVLRNTFSGDNPSQHYISQVGMTSLSGQKWRIPAEFLRSRSFTISLFPLFPL
jgi:hypothetical protein